MSSAVVVDACFVLRLVVEDATSGAAEAKWREWRGEGRATLAPRLLLFEAANALHQYVRHGAFSAARAEEALEALLGLGLTIDDDERCHREALRLAQQLSQNAAYDSHYLALAALRRCELWTADGRLVRAVGGRFPRLRLLGG